VLTVRSVVHYLTYYIQHYVRNMCVTSCLSFSIRCILLIALPLPHSSHHLFPPSSSILSPHLHPPLTPPNPTSLHPPIHPLLFSPLSTLTSPHSHPVLPLLTPGLSCSRLHAICLQSVRHDLYSRTLHTTCKSTGRPGTVPYCTVLLVTYCTIVTFKTMRVCVCVCVFVCLCV
jgi:hypothetical protein